jgi:N-acetyltransferase 10
MGYGSRALKALNSFYSGEYFSLDEASRPEPSYPDAAAISKACLLIIRLVHQGYKADHYT